ncbi:hypothetical protein FRC00_007438 [Tulasnella sp. 408]|nr:hypothetical protein FRC00_007438 [Tulasnella sp. 408]
MAEPSTFPPPSPTIQSTRVQSVAEEDEIKSKIDLETGGEVETVNADDEKVPMPEPAAAKSESAAATPGPPPDGGLRAWLAVAGFGFANAFGVFQAYYAKTIPGVTQFSIAWIGSLQYSLIFLPVGLSFVHRLSIWTDSRTLGAIGTTSWPFVRHRLSQTNACDRVCCSGTSFRVVALRMADDLLPYIPSKGYIHFPRRGV